MGLFMWLNFSWVNAMYIYWPVILLALLLLIQFFPAKILYHRARLWWAISNVRFLTPPPLFFDDWSVLLTSSSQWRLWLSGLYPIEFRDFFLGDMASSQTYSMGVRAIPTIAGSDALIMGSRTSLCFSAFMHATGMVWSSVTRAIRDY